MSIAESQRLKLLELRVLELENRLDALETKREPFVDPLPAFEPPKRGPGRPRKDGH